MEGRQAELSCGLGSDREVSGGECARINRVVDGGGACLAREIISHSRIEIQKCAPEREKWLI